MHHYSGSSPPLRPVRQRRRALVQRLCSFATPSEHAMANQIDPSANLKSPGGPVLVGLGHHGGVSSPDAFAANLLGSLLRFKDGDFSSRMPSDLIGIEGKIADVFNEILAVSERRAHETARVCRVVGKEGKLKERMRVPGAVGGWADEVAALNTLIDDMVWPTTEVTRAVGAVA